MSCSFSPCPGAGQHWRLAGLLWAWTLYLTFAMILMQEADTELTPQDSIPGAWSMACTLSAIMDAACPFSMRITEVRDQTLKHMEPRQMHAPFSFWTDSSGKPCPGTTCTARQCCTSQDTDCVQGLMWQCFQLGKYAACVPSAATSAALVSSLAVTSNSEGQGC